MPDNIHHCVWYTVYDAKTGDLLASGTSEMCAKFKEVSVKTILFIVLLLNLGYIFLGWRRNGRR